MHIDFIEKIGLGKLSLEFSAIINGETVKGEYKRVCEDGCVYRAETESFSDEIAFGYENGIVAKRVFKNIGSDTIKLNKLKVVISGLDFGGEARDDYFYHNENPRIYEAFTFPIDYNRTADDAKNSEFDAVGNNKWADPGVVSEYIGASPYQPFPAILVGNYKKNTALVHGTLSQDVFYHCYLVGHGDGVELSVFSAFKDINYRNVGAGEALLDEWYLGKTDNADDIEKIFETYTKVLRTRLTDTYGRRDINRHDMVWGSWNDGIRRNLNEELVLNEAKAAKKYFPTVKWIQIDDGYGTYHKHTEIAHGLGIPYEGEEGIDYDKFPDGLHGLADKIKAIGLRPALWVGGSCPPNTKIRNEHPEWFIDYTYRVDYFRPLDVSQAEVREYMKSAINKLIVGYGFEGIKHDFWSYAFEDSHDLYKIKDKSGYEMRDWWTEEIRKTLPEDGYMQTGCDIAMANPFLSKTFTNYRYGIDVGSGDWENIVINLLWGAACYALHMGDIFVPNSDAIGLFLTLPDNAFMFWTNYVIISRSGVELAGRYSFPENVGTERFEIVRKAACNPNNGQDVHFINFNYRKTGRTVPEIFYLKTPHFSELSECEGLPLRTFAIFNSLKESTHIEFKAEQLGLPAGEYTFVDVWSGERFVADGFSYELAGESSKMYAVCKSGELTLLDANFKVTSCKVSKAKIEFETAYPVPRAIFSLTNPPRSISLNGVKLAFENDGDKVICDFDAAGTVTIEF